MKILINEKEYQLQQSTFLKEVLEKNNIKLSSYSSQMVELADKNRIVNSNNIFTYNDMKVLTDTSKVYKYISNEIKDKKMEFETIKLDVNKYNVLLCKPELYQDALEKYQSLGFNDIVNTRFSDIILGIELSDTILKYITKKLDKKEVKPLYIYTPSLINNDNLVQIKPSEEIASIIIKTYIANTLNIEKDIVIYYLTDCKFSKISESRKAEFYPSLVDYILLKDNFEIEPSNDTFDGVISRKIYLKESEDSNKSITFHTIVELISKMGLKVEAIELFQKEDYLLIYVTYEGIKIKYLVTKHILSEEDINNSGVDVAFTTVFELEHLFENEPNVLVDYNVNKIYRKFLIKPGYSDIFRR